MEAIILQSEFSCRIYILESIPTFETFPDYSKNIITIMWLKDEKKKKLCFSLLLRIVTFYFNKAKK